MDRPINLVPAMHNFQAKCNQNVDAAMHIFFLFQNPINFVNIEPAMHNLQKALCSIRKF